MLFVTVACGLAALVFGATASLLPEWTLILVIVYLAW